MRRLVPLVIALRRGSSGRMTASHSVVKRHPTLAPGEARGPFRCHGAYPCMPIGRRSPFLILQRAMYQFGFDIGRDRFRNVIGRATHEQTDKPSPVRDPGHGTTTTLPTTVPG